MMPALLLALLMALPQAGSGTVAGQIHTAAGAPAAGMRVAALEVPASQADRDSGTALLASITETDDNGRYKLENIPPGRYYVVAGGLDAPTYYAAGSSPSNSQAAKPVAVAAGATVSGIDFSVPQAWLRVRGRVLGASADARVEMRGATGGRLPEVPTAAVAPDGSFEFNRVQPGAYILNAYWELADLQLGPVRPAIPPIAIHIEDRNIEGLEIGITGAVKVAGQAIATEDGPIPRLQFALTRSPATILISTVVAADGTFNVALPEGEFHVGAEVVPDLYRIESLTYGAVDLLKSPLRIDARRPATLQIHLIPKRPPIWKALRGHIVGGFGARDVPEITLRGGVLDMQYKTRVAADGSFEFKVLEGTYRLTASGTAYAATKTLVVNEDRVTDTELRVSGLYKVTGRIVVSNGSEPPHMKVSFTSTIWHVNLYSWPEPDGTFELDLPNGPHLIDLGPLPDGYTVKSIAKGKDVIQDQIEIADSKNPEIVITLDAPRRSQPE